MEALEAPASARCSGCSRACARARPTATGAWPTGPPPTCCTSGRGSANGARQPPQRAQGAHAGRQHRRRARDLPPQARRAARVGHRGLRAPGLALGADVAQRRRAGRRRSPTRSRPRARPPGGVATLIVPADSAWGDADGRRRRAGARRARARGRRRDRAGGGLRWPASACCCSAATRSRERGLLAAGRIAAATGCRAHGRDVPRAHGARRRACPDRAPAVLPGAGDAARWSDARPRPRGHGRPIAFFAYPDKPSELAAGRLPDRGAQRARPGRVDALERLAERLGVADGAAAGARAAAAHARPARSRPTTLAAALAAAQPEGAIVVDEGITGAARTGRPRRARRATRWLALTGGAIGHGPPPATGAAVACPDRPVLCLQADGSAMYTLQALWTQAREGLDVTTVIFANRGLRRSCAIELQRAGVARARRRASRRCSTSARPTLDWVALAARHGRARGPGDDRRGADRRARARARRARAASHRSGAVVRSDELASNADLHERVAASAGGRVLRARPPRAALRSPGDVRGA